MGLPRPMKQTPTMLVRRPPRQRASGFGRKPTSSIAAMMRRRVFSVTSGWPLIARDTVQFERPRYFAKSEIEWIGFAAGRAGRFLGAGEPEEAMERADKRGARAKSNV